MNQNKAIVITIIIILAIGLLWITKPWQKLDGESEGGETGENHQGENIIEYEGTLFRCTASFQYLSSEDNGPIEDQLFLVFPCPTIDNKPAVLIGDPVPGSGTEHPIENLRWGLIAFYENDSENIWHVEMENGVPATFVPPRENAPDYIPPSVENTSHGPKVWFQLSYGFPEPENVLYQNEIIQVSTKFLVTENNENKVTLVDNQGGVYVGADGYTGDNYKQIRYSMEAKLSKWVNTHFRTVENYSMIEGNQAEAEWIDMRSK